MRRPDRTGLFAFFATLLVFAGLCGCHATRPLRLRVHVGPQANQDRPLAVDLVAAGDKRLSELLSKTSATEWFERRDQFRRDYPQPGLLEVQSWEWVPGQVVGEQKIRLGGHARGVYLFARYASGGEHRARLDVQRETTVTFGEQAMTVKSSPKGMAWPKH